MLDVFIAHTPDRTPVAQELYIVLKAVFPNIRVGADFLQDIATVAESKVAVSVYLTTTDFPDEKRLDWIYRSLISGRREHAILWGRAHDYSAAENQLSRMGARRYSTVEADLDLGRFGDAY